MAALQESVQKAKTVCGEDAGVHDLPANKEETAAKKAAKRTAPKTSGRKPRRSA